MVHMDRTENITSDVGTKGAGEWKLFRAVMHEHLDGYPVRQPRIVHLKVRREAVHRPQHFILKGAH